MVSKLILCNFIVAVLLFPSIAYCQTSIKEELVILCMGDSITAGSYPERLQTKLNRAGISAKVLNCGMSGYTSGYYLNFMKSFDLFKAVTPDIILLQLGTNDTREDFANTSTEKFLENMRNIINLIRGKLYKEKSPQVLISTIPPINPGQFIVTEKSAKRVIEEINPAIRELSDELGLLLVDNFELFKNNPDWLEDGIHPNERGYEAMADNWFARLNKVISKKSNPSKKTGLVYSEIYLEHDTGKNHPETPERLKAIIKHLKEKEIFSKLILIEPKPASINWITTIHTPEYVEHVKEGCKNNQYYLDSRDTSISSKSYEAAILAAGGVLTAIDAVMEGKVRNAFCAIRPPGHHALKDRAMGFCLFNNVAIATRYIQKKYGFSKVLIVDWDVHHGNGTQDAFYDDADVLYFSIHQYPFYPGTGKEEEKGEGKGLGYNINVPLPAGSGDSEYIKAFEEKLKPKALEFKPDFVIISAGFDAYKDDLIGGMRVTVEGFREMTKIVKEIAEKCAQGRLVSVLEGGYDLNGLAHSVEAHISVLME